MKVEPLISTFGETPIEVRLYGKREFAEALSISPNTLWKYLSHIRTEIEEVFPNYNHRARTLKPAVIRFFLKRYGWL